MAYLSTILDVSTGEELSYQISNRLSLDIATATILKLMAKPNASQTAICPCHYNHPLVARGTIDLAEAANESFVFPSPDQSVYTIYLQACRDDGFAPKIVCQSSHSETSLALVGVGMGVGFFPLETLNYIEQYGVSIIRLTQPVIKHVALALLKRLHHPPTVAAFCDYVLDQDKLPSLK